MENRQLMFVKRAILVVHHAKEIRTIARAVLEIFPFYQIYAMLTAP